MPAETTHNPATEPLRGVPELGPAAPESMPAYNAVLEEPQIASSEFGGEAAFVRVNSKNSETGEASPGLPVYFAGGYAGVKPVPLPLYCRAGVRATHHLLQLGRPRRVK